MSMLPEWSNDPTSLRMQINQKKAELLSLQIEKDARIAELEKDAKLLDWLERKLVEVRQPLPYGSRPLFFSQEISEEWEEYRTNIRAAVRAAMQAEDGGVKGD